jgi:hypothetical protein
MKKIALLFSGQVRSLPINLFNNSLKNFINGFEADIYISCWNDVGISLNHGNTLRKKEFEGDKLELILNKMFAGTNVIKLEIENKADWESSLNEEYRKINYSLLYSDLTKNALAQLYKIKKSFSLIPKEKMYVYDLIIRVRLDSIFIDKFHYIDNNKINNINFRKIKDQNKRIYDIFFYGKPNVVSSIFNTYDEIPRLILSKIETGMDRRDACLLLYQCAKINNIGINNDIFRFVDIYREPQNLFNYVSKMIYWGLSPVRTSGINTLKIVNNLYKFGGYSKFTREYLFLIGQIFLGFNIIFFLYIYTVRFLK